MKQYFQKCTGHLAMVILFIFFATLAHAQTQRKPDIINLRNDKKLEVLIQEVQEKEVKYKKVTDPDGPIFSVNKSEIISINYGNGETDTFEAVLDVPNYYTPSNGKSAPAPPVRNQASAMPGSRNAFLEEIRNSNSDHLRAIYKFYKTKSKNNLLVGIIGTVTGTVIAGIGTGMIVNSMDVNGYYTSRAAELRARNGALLTLGGFAGAVTCGTVGFIKAGKNGTKASKIKRELVKRGEPLVFSIAPGFSPLTRSGSLTVALKF